MTTEQFLVNIYVPAQVHLCLGTRRPMGKSLVFAPYLQSLAQGAGGEAAGETDRWQLRASGRMMTEQLVEVQVLAQVQLCLGVRRPMGKGLVPATHHHPLAVQAQGAVGEGAGEPDGWHHGGGEQVQAPGEEGARQVKACNFLKSIIIGIDRSRRNRMTKSVALYGLLQHRR